MIKALVEGEVGHARSVAAQLPYTPACLTLECESMGMREIGIPSNLQYSRISALVPIASLCTLLPSCTASNPS